MSHHEGPTHTSAPPKLPATLRLGAVHLSVSDLERSVDFYEDAGGYHHHLGFNIWRGEGVPPVPEDRVGLRHWTVVLDDPEEVEAVRERVLAAGIATEEREGGGFLVRDPWGIAVLFVPAQSFEARRKADL